MSEEKETEVVCRNVCIMERGKSVRDSYTDNGLWICPHSSRTEKFLVCDIGTASNCNTAMFSSSEDQVGKSSGIELIDAKKRCVPSLIDELEVLILARVPRSEYWKFCFVNKRFLSYVRSGELFKARRSIGFKECSVFLSVSGEINWWTFDWQSKSPRKLPILPSDISFSSDARESVCAGTSLIVSVGEISSIGIWRYELASNKWFKGPSMINGRYFFASATFGIFAFVAGGVGLQPSEVLDSAEAYDSENKLWNPLPRMHRKRQSCSGCFMDNKFYVIGGTTAKGEILTCGEAYDVAQNSWKLVPDMLRHTPPLSMQFPPLVAVANNELYLLEVSSNELKVYLKGTNTWKKLGPLPIRAGFNPSWNIGFKSLGNELLVIGKSSVSYAGHGMAIFSCCPDPDADELQWRHLEFSRIQGSHLLFTCSVMEA